MKKKTTNHNPQYSYKTELKIQIRIKTVLQENKSKQRYCSPARRRRVRKKEKEEEKMKLFSPTPPPPPSPLVRYPSSSRPTNCFLHGRPWPPPPSTPLPLRWPCSLPRWAVFPTRAAVEPEPAVRREVVDVEAEIYEFMVLSAKPELFPTRGELLAAGRGDLVDAVAREGGWLAFGWDFDDEVEDGRVSQGRLDGLAPEGGSFPPEMEVAGYSGRSGRALSSWAS